MKALEIRQLLVAGASDRVRKKLKRLALPERMSALQGCIQAGLINESPINLKFFKENFIDEIGSILLSEGDLVKAVGYYNESKRIK
jgi:hypothetical protein